MTDYVVRREPDGNVLAEIYLEIDGVPHKVDSVNITRGFGRPPRLEVTTLAGQKHSTDLELGDTLRVTNGRVVRKEVERG